MSAQPVYIYALVDKCSRECLYVGQTVNPAKRMEAHRRGKLKKRFRNCGCVVLRTSTRPDAYRIELQIIASFQRRAQAVFNNTRFGGPIYVIDDGSVMWNVEAAMRRFGILSVKTMMNHVRDGYVGNRNESHHECGQTFSICAYDPERHSVKNHCIWSGYSI